MIQRSWKSRGSIEATLVLWAASAGRDAVTAVGKTGLLKQGKASRGVGRPYTGSAGKVTNCQIGLFAAYLSRHGHAFIDRAR